MTYLAPWLRALRPYSHSTAKSGCPVRAQSFQAGAALMHQKPPERGFFRFQTQRLY
jgi:hypothetical protein